MEKQKQISELTDLEIANIISQNYQEASRLQSNLQGLNDEMIRRNKKNLDEKEKKEVINK